MKILIILVCFAFTAITCLTNYEKEWTNFKLSNGKKYKTRNEENYRKGIFISNLQTIEKNNKLYEQGLSSFQTGINEFADLTTEELIRTHTGFGVHKNDKSANQKTFILTKNDIPDSIDWTERNYEEEWTNFKIRYGKEFKMKTEESYRKTIFISNLQKIEEHNKLYEQGLKNYSMKMNQFAHLHHNELTKIYNGFKISKTSNSVINQIPFLPPKDNVPETIDWRELGAVTHVKDQLLCGSCWAFSCTGALEAQLFLKIGKLISISEQNLIDCAKGEYVRGCDGGDMVSAFEYVIKNKGIESEEKYPYEGKENVCRYYAPFSVTSAKKVVMINTADENVLKLAVATAGPVTAAIDAHHEQFLYYSKGIYYQEDCKEGLTDDSDLTHAVLVVGYGSENGQDYWLVKNSWSKDWGEDGYIKMARNRNNNCGIATYASYPLI